MSDPKSALILFAHGARDARWSQTLDALAQAIRRLLPDTVVAPAFLEFQPPSLTAALHSAVAVGCTKVDVLPVFWASGGHVACLSAHDFTQELIDAIDRDGVAAWRNRYRRCSALLIDDVHLVAGKERTQEELFLLFNLFLESNRQLGFASAVPLAELSGVEPRLLTRLEGGLVVELPPPDRELRQQLVERTLSSRGQDADAELMTYIASRPAESARAVQGYVQRVLHSADSQQVKPTVALAREVLEGGARVVRKGSAPGRSISVSAASSGGVKSNEKMVRTWPTLADRVIEEWR